MTDLNLKNIDDPEVCYSLISAFLAEYSPPSTGYEIDRASLRRLIRDIVDMPEPAFNTLFSLIKQLRKGNGDVLYAEEN